MTLEDLADVIYAELGSPTSPDTTAIEYWLENNYGALNIAIGSSFVLNESGDDLVPELSIEEANIYEAMYFCRFYGRQITSNLGAAAYDWSEVSEDGDRIRRVSKNEIAKSYKSLRDSVCSELAAIIKAHNAAQNTPVSYDRSGSLGVDRSYGIGCGGNNIGNPDNY